MNASLRKRLGDVWLGADAHQRIRALQSSIASFLMFGMYSLRPRVVHLLALWMVLVIGATMALLATLNPAVYDPMVEIGHFITVGIILPIVALLAGNLSRLRERLREQKIDLSKA